MSWLRNFFAKLFGKKSQWDGLDYGKPSASGDDFRDKNNV